MVVRAKMSSTASRFQRDVLQLSVPAGQRAQTKETHDCESRPDLEDELLQIAHPAAEERDERLFLGRDGRVRAPELVNHELKSSVGVGIRAGDGIDGARGQGCTSRWVSIMSDGRERRKLTFG